MQVPCKKVLAQSFARHCCNNKEQIV